MSNVEDRRDYGTFIPSFLDDFGLDMPCFRLYAHIARRAGSGLCWESIDKMAKTCHMDRKTAYKAFNLLQQHKLILVEKRAGQTSLITLTNHSVWIPIPNQVQVGGVPKQVQVRDTPIPNQVHPPIPNQVHPPIPNQVHKGTPSEGTPSEGVFLEAKKTNLPEQKKDLSAFEDPQIQETPPPTPAPLPPENIGYSDPMGDRFRDAGKRIRQVESWLKDDEFLKYLQPIMKRSDYYKDSTSMGDVRDYVRKAKINTPEKLVFYESLSDRYQDFLDSQQRSPQPMAELPELAAIAPPPDYLRNKFKKVS